MSRKWAAARRLVDIEMPLPCSIGIHRRHLPTISFVSMTLRLTGKWPQRNPDSLRDAIAPFRCKLRRIFIEQLIGVDAVAHEGPAAEVVNEQIMGHGQLEPCPPRPFGKIIVVEKSESEAFVEPADRLVDRTFHEQAESGEFGNSKPRPAVLLSPSLGKSGHVFERW